MTTKPRQTCTDHCGGCNQHFHGLKAFDAHRLGMKCTPGAEAIGRKDQPLLQAWTTNGWCSLQTGCRAEGHIVQWLNPVTIWQTYGTSYKGPRNAEA